MAEKNLGKARAEGQTISPLLYEGEPKAKAQLLFKFFKMPSIKIKFNKEKDKKAKDFT